MEALRGEGITNRNGVGEASGRDTASLRLVRSVGTADGISLNAAQPQVAGFFHGERDIKGLLQGCRSGAMVSDIEIYQNADLPVGIKGGLLVPLNLGNVINHHHSSRGNGSGHLAGVSEGRREEEVCDARFSQEFGLGNRRATHPACPGGDLAAGERQAFVSLHMGPQLLSGSSGIGSSAGDIGLHQGEVNDQRGGWDGLFGQRQLIFSDSLGSYRSP